MLKRNSVHLSRTREPETVMFLHIPKTAGTSVTNALMAMKFWNQILTSDGNITAELLQKYNTERGHAHRVTLIHGHACHDILRLAPKAKLLTVVRDPESHAVSNYLHVQRSADTPLHHDANALSFQDFLRKHWQFLVFQNISLDVSNSPRPICNKNDFFARLSAVRRLLDRIDYVGTTDDLVGFFTRLARDFYIPAPSVPESNRAIDHGVSPQRIAALCASYRTLAEDASLAPLIAEERALYLAAQRRTLETVQNLGGLSGSQSSRPNGLEAG